MDETMRTPISHVLLDFQASFFRRSPVGLGMARCLAAWCVLAVVMTVLGYLYADSLRFLVQAWLEDDNYSHGPFIPLISLYLVWLRWTQLKTVEQCGA
jgi:hypothetical protein